LQQVSRRRTVRRHLFHQSEDGPQKLERLLAERVICPEPSLPGPALRKYREFPTQQVPQPGVPNR
jgi:hypothetical protein